MNLSILIVISLIAVTMITAFSIVGLSEQASGYKECPQHGCKGTKGWYYKGTHHHCWKGAPKCVKGSG